MPCLLIVLSRFESICLMIRFTLQNGMEVLIRPILPCDIVRMRESRLFLSFANE